MSIVTPSQFQCDNMQDGDIIMLTRRSHLYGWYRKKFKKDLKVLRVALNPAVSKQKVLVYQEDCTLVYGYELACVTQYKDTIPYLMCSNPDVKPRPNQNNVFKSVTVDLNNIKFVFKDGTSIYTPVHFIADAISKNNERLDSYNDNRIILDKLKFTPYKGKYFKEYAERNCINTKVMLYCTVCGKPVIANFKKDCVDINNCCECGATTVSASTITYDEFAVWYHSITGEAAQKRNKEFWFGESDNCEK